MSCEPKKTLEDEALSLEKSKPISLFSKFGNKINVHPMPPDLPKEMRGSYDENGAFFTGD